MASLAPGLPAAVNRLVGRSSEIAGVDDAFRSARLVTVTGPGGVGKTRLALELARRRARRTDQVVFVDLSVVVDPELVPTAFTRALRLHAPGNDMNDVVRFLHETSGLVLIDNCEHLVDAAAEAVTSLLEGCPKLRVLATSRETLRVPGETVWPLAPLALDEAFALFVERAEAARPGSASGSESEIEEICARLEGLPLAIELAAARVAALSPQAILERLGGRLDLLSVDRRGTPMRHRSLHATLEWSYDLLDEQERVSFPRLAIFAGSFTMAAAATVADVDLGTLSGLVAKSLVAAEPRSGGDVRYRLLEVVRAYARELLSSAGEVDTLAARHLAFFVTRAEEVYESNALGGADAEARALADELDNLRSAVHWAGDHDPDTGLRLVGASRQAWYRGSTAEGLAWARRLLETHPEPDRVRALGLLCAGHLAIAHHDHAAARPPLREAVQLAEQLDDTGILAAALHYLGLSGMLSRDLDAAERDLTRSIALFRTLGQTQGVGRSLGILGLVRLYGADPAGAAAVLEEGLRAARDCGDAWGEGQVLLASGLTAKASGDPAGALDYLSRAVRVLGSTGDATILGVALATIGGLVLHRDPTRALRLAGAAVGLRERIGGGYPPGTVDELASIRRGGTEALGEAGAAREWEAGRRVDPAEASRIVAGGRPRPAHSPLTPRQLEVGHLVADGLTNAQVAVQLHLSERTVENHIFNALRSLGLRNRVQLATWVAERSREGVG